MESPAFYRSTVPRPIIFEQNEPIYMIVNRFGKNWRADIIGRMFWYYERLEISPEQKLAIRNRNIERRKNGEPEKNDLTSDLVYLKEATSCILTHNAVMAAFFGKWFRDSKTLLNYDKDPQLAINQIKKMILSKESASSEAYRKRNAIMGYPSVASVPLDENHWTAYSVKILTLKPERNQTLHAFVLLQFSCEGKIFYKILQSFVNQYPFNHYDFTYDTEKIFVMLDDILNLLMSYVWNGNHKRLFEGYFCSRQPVAYGKPIKFKNSLIIRSGDFDRQALEKNAADFRDAYPTDYAFTITRNNNES